MKNQKVPYICGPLTELPPEIKGLVLRTYEGMGRICQKINGKSAFVPHRDCEQAEGVIDRIEREQISKKTSLLIVLAIEPSWGGGIEVEIANTNGVPVLIFCKNGKRLSQLLLENPAIKEVIYYDTFIDVLSQLRILLENPRPWMKQ